MSDDFLDSNVPLYMFDTTDPRKREIAVRVVTRALEAEAVISHQVVQEVLNVLVHRLRATVSLADALEFYRVVLLPMWRVMPTPALYERALDIQGRYGYALYDSLIVAAALQAGCKRILSEDLQHGHNIDGVLIENPFLVSG